MFSICDGAWGQFGALVNRTHAPQARTQEELDLYLEIYSGREPGTVLQKAAEFAMLYPDSDLRGYVYQYEMMARRDLEDYDGVIEAGEKALSLIPNNLNTLLTLASVIPNGVTGRLDAEMLLGRAEKYAQAALQELETIRIPHTIPLDRWEAMQAKMQSEAYESLGMIAVKRERLDLAIQQFRAAVERNPEPSASQFYRLGAAYVMTRQYDQARAPLSKAAELDHGVVGQLAEKELARIRERQ